MVMAATNSVPMDLQLRAHVDTIHVDGLIRTKDDYVQSALYDLFKTSTLQDMLSKSAEIRTKLERLGCFRKVEILVDTSKGPKATPHIGYDITFKVHELRPISGGLQTNIENNQGSIGGTIKAQNIFGRGELLQSEMRYSSKKWRTFYTSFVKPFSFCDGSFKFATFKDDIENAVSGYKVDELGAVFGPSMTYCDLINHKLEYECVFRKVEVLNRNVPFTIREASGLTMKSSIRNTLQLDTRNLKIFPSSGSLLELKSEVAGLGGNIGFVKNELVSQINAPLGPFVNVQGSFATGIINELTNDKPYSLVDKFFIGGPLSLRGFDLNTVGPKSESFPIGGSLYWIGAMHLYTALPHMPKPGTFGDLFRIHLFCNAGSLVERASNLRECFHRLGNSMRLTYGIGLAARLGHLARIELNYCFPLKYELGDKLADGIQFGIGVHFL